MTLDFREAVQRSVTEFYILKKGKEKLYVLCLLCLIYLFLNRYSANGDNEYIDPLLGDLFTTLASSKGDTCRIIKKLNIRGAVSVIKSKET